MNKAFFLAIVPSLLMMACSDTGAYEKSKAAASESISIESEASAKLYFGDISESVKDKPKKEEDEESVEKDTKQSRMKNMAQKLLDHLDVDDSGDLTVDEFAALAIHPNKDKAAKQLPEELQKIQDKLRAEFDKFAGDDKLLSIDEIPAALKGQGKRVGGFRKEKHPGKSEERKKEIEKQLLSQFDKDGDGKLSPEEAALIRQDDKKECKDRAGKGHKPDEKKPGEEEKKPADPAPKEPTDQ